jgi:glucokinase
MVIDGCLWEGSAGIAGEIGHTVVDIDGPRCSCGNRGCLEALVSATAIVRDYRRRKRVKSGAALSARSVFELAGKGDRAAREVVDAAAVALGVGIANVYYLLNPEIILIGGGVSRAGSMLIAPATEHARSRIFAPLRAGLRVGRAKLGDDAALLGAAHLAFQRLRI